MFLKMLSEKIDMSSKLWIAITSVLIAIIIVLVEMLVNVNTNYLNCIDKLNKCELSNTQYNQLVNVLEKEVINLSRNTFQNIKVFAKEINLRTFKSFDEYVIKVSQLISREDLDKIYGYMVEKIPEIFTRNIPLYGKIIIIYNHVKKHFKYCEDPKVPYVEVRSRNVRLVTGKIVKIPIIKVIYVKEFIKLPTELLNGTYKCGDCDDINLLTYFMIYTFLKMYYFEKYPYYSNLVKVYLGYWYDYENNVGHIFVMIHDKVHNVFMIVDPVVKCWTLGNIKFVIIQYVKLVHELTHVNPTFFKLVEFKLVENKVFPQLVVQGTVSDIINYFT